MPWPRGTPRSLAALTPTLRRYLDAAARIAPPGGVVADRMLAAEMGVGRPAATRARGRLGRLGLWPWRTGGPTDADRRRATEAKVVAAAHRLAVPGGMLTVAAIAREAKVGRRSAREAIARLGGQDRWPFVMNRRIDPLAVLAANPGPTKRDPTPAVILSACRAILILEVGFSIEAADMRLGAKAMRYGSGALP